MYDKNQAHYIVVTGILVKENKYLIVKRANWEKAFPEKWTVPGGKLKVLDYVLKEKDTKDHWYNVLENVLKREVKEEVGVEVKNIGYVTSMVYIRPDKIPAIIISLFAEPVSENILLCDALTEYAWVSLEESKEYDLIEGIYEELELLDKHLGKNILPEWKRQID